MPNWRRYASRHARYQAGIHYNGMKYSKPVKAGSGCLVQILSAIGIVGLITTLLIIIF